MPNCFQLTRKTDLAAGPVNLQTIDEEMCKHFNRPVHPVRYYAEWYNTIGFSLAMGQSFDEQRKDIEHALTVCVDENETQYRQEQLDVLNWLDANFTSNAFAQIGKY